MSRDDSDKQAAARVIPSDLTHYMSGNDLQSPHIAGGFPFAAAGSNIYGQLAISDAANAVVGNIYHSGDTYQINQATVLVSDSPSAPPFNNATDFTRRRIRPLSRVGPSGVAIANWLGPATYETHHRDAFSSVHTGTGQWLLNSVEFCQWKQTRGHVLVLIGPPGTGKTCLAAVAIDHLRSTFSKDASTVVLYSYCSFQRSNERTAEAIISCLLRQAFWQDPVRGRPVRSLYDDWLQHRKMSRPGLQDLLQALQGIMCQYSRIMIVIDGLDECVMRGEASKELDLFLGVLTSWHRDASICPSVLMTARPTSVHLPYVCLAKHMIVKARPEDTSKYITHRLEGTSNPLFQTDKWTDMIRDAVLKASDGSFLLTKMHIDHTVVQSKPRDLELMLQRFHWTAGDLNMAHETALARIKAGSKMQLQLAGRTLSCMIFSKRPLKLAELLHAIAIEPDMEDISDDDLDDYHHVLEACAHLVVLDQSSGTVRILHHTTYQFFETLLDPWFCDYRDYLAKACILYMSVQRIQNVGEYELYTPTAGIDPTVGNIYPFLGYALSFWSLHLSDDSQKLHWPTAIEAFRSARLVALAFDRARLGQRFDYPSTYGRLSKWSHLFAALNHGDLLEFGAQLLSSDGDLGALRRTEYHAASTWQKHTIAHQRDLEQDTPLVYAAATGHLDLVQRLIAWGHYSDRSFPSYLAHSFLQALRHSHDHVARWLVAHFHESIIPNQLTFQQAMTNAIVHRAPGTVRCLLRMRQVTGTILEEELFSHAGATSSREIIDMILTECQKDSNFTRWWTTTLFSAATESYRDSSRFELAKHLLSHSPENINLTSKGGETILHIACSDVNIPLCDYLCTFPGLDYGIADARGNNPLMAACLGVTIHSRISTYAAQAFLRRICEESDLTYRNPKTGFTALHTLAYWLSKRTIRYDERTTKAFMDVLLGAGLDSSIRDFSGLTASETLQQGGSDRFWRNA